MTILTLKTQIYPTKNQISYFKKAFGIRRFVWNWGLSNYLESLTDRKYKTSYDLQKELNNGLVKDPDYLWLSEVNSMVRGESLKDLGISIKRYHDEQRRARKTTGFVDSEKFKPKYKSKKNDINSFRMNNKGNPVRPNGRKHFYLTTNKDVGRFNIKCAESLNFLNHDDVRFIKITIKEYAGQYYATITYEKTNHKVKKPNAGTKIGVDMGIKTPLTCWDGKESFILNPLERIKKAEKKREKADRKFGRKLNSYKLQQKSKTFTKGFKFRESNRYLKCRRQLQKAYQKEENIKKDFREKTTTWLVQNYHTINIEPFNNGFKRSRRAVARISQYAFYECLKYKAEMYGTEINWISWEPTTQTCSSCGHRFVEDEKLLLKDRKYVCPNCGMAEDRDINAAKNIYNLK